MSPRRYPAGWACARSIAGNQITANSPTPITVVTQIDPIDVSSPCPRRHRPDREPRELGAGLPVTAFDRAGGAVAGDGQAGHLDNVIDTTTGTVKGKARFANPGGALFPNQFVNVTVLVDTLQEPGDRAHHGDPPRPAGRLRLGPAAGPHRHGAPREEWARAPAETISIASGLTVGETVITDGGDRLRDGRQGDPAGPETGAAAGGGQWPAAGLAAAPAATGHGGGAPVSPGGIGRRPSVRARRRT